MKTLNFLLHRGLFGAFLLPIFSASAAAPKWHWQNPLPQGSLLRAVRWLDDRFVAVGDGVVVTSPDGVAWNLQTAGEHPGFMYDVARGNGRFVVAGSRTALHSTDGLTWEHAPIAVDLSTVTFAKGAFWGGGMAAWPNPSDFAPSVFRSIDGVTWERVHSAPPEFRGYMDHILEFNGRLIAGGGAANNYRLVLWHSDDGEEWSDAVVPEADSFGFLIHFAQGNGEVLGTFGGGLFSNGRRPSRGVEFLLRSADGIEWTKLPGSLNRRELAFADGLFVSAPGFSDLDSRAARSTDGRVWQQNFSAFEGNEVATSVAHGAGVFAAVGQSGMIYTSADGIEWTRRGGGLAVGPFGFYGLEAHEGRLFAAGYTGGILESEDGRNWARQPEEFSITTKSLRRQGGQFVMVGGYEFGDAHIAVSPDGRDWDTVLTLEAQGYELYDLAHGGAPGAESHVVAGFRNGHGVIFTSPDGLTWTERTLAEAPEFSRRLYAIARGAGRFVAVGDGGTVISSAGGVDWTLGELLEWAPGFPADLRGVRFLNGRFLAVGNRSIFESADGLSWTRLPLIGVSSILRDAAYGDGWYAVVGDSGTIVMSEDLLTWTTSPRLTFATLTKVIHGSGAFHAVGHESAILSTTPPDGGPVQPTIRIRRQGEQLRLEWDAPGFTLESTPDLEGGWEPLEGATSPLLFNPDLPEEFFQLRQDP